MVARRKAPAVRAANWYRQSDVTEAADNAEGPFAGAATAGSRLSAKFCSGSGDLSLCSFITSLLGTSGRMAYKRIDVR
jgi:hypothetical protein